MNPVQRSQTLFFETYNMRPSKVSFAPGRVEILGNHTDYNEGYVMPFALDRGTSVAGRQRDDRICRLVSSDFDGLVEFSVDDIVSDPARSWSDYPKGVLWAFRSEGVHLTGWDGAIASDVPVAAGLSSSAALEVATALVLEGLWGLDWERMRLARLCQKAENEFVGVKCGILDQFSSLFGQPDCGLFLDCRSLDYSVLPMGNTGVSLVICDTLEKHNLIASKYNERREECEAAAASLARFDPSVRFLRDVSLSLLREHGQDVPEPARRRAMHVVTENERVLAGRKALEEGSLEKLGRLMCESHESSRRCFENSTVRLDFLVEQARSLPGCLGSKLCGGGFGGCTVHLVDMDKKEEVARRLEDAYKAWCGLAPRLHCCGIGGGARVE